MRVTPSPVPTSRAAAIVRLQEAGLLGAEPSEDDEAAGGETPPIGLVRAPWSAVRRALGAEGFAETGPTPDGRGRRFAGYDAAADRWVHLDVAPPGGMAASAPGDERSRALPGLVVAILGPDGAGKTTLTEAMAAAFELPARRFYAGLYPAGRRRHRLPGLDTLDVLRRQARLARAASRGRRAGCLVLFDRFAYDARLPLPPGAGRRSRLRRGLIARSTTTPDLVVVLDAPADVLLARRREHSREVIEAQRERYAELARTVPDGVVVDASPDAESVRRAVTAIIWSRVVERRQADVD